MASYSQFGAMAQPVLYGDDEESKKAAQTAQPQTAPVPQVAPPTAPQPTTVPGASAPPMRPTAGAVAPNQPVGQQPAYSPPPPTFAQMQAQGQARPAPPTTAPQGVSLQSPTTQAAPTGDMDRWRQQVAQIAAVPTRFDDLAFMQMRNASQADLEADFANQRQRLDETLASRGLYDSSIAGNQYRDLGGQQARAMANLDSQLLREMAQTQMQDRLASAGLSGQLASFGENARQFDVQQQLAQTLGLGNLDLNRQQLGQQDRQFGQSLAQNDLARQLQERLAMTEMSGVYQGADGQRYNTLSRDRLAVDREVGGNDLLIRLASMLGMDGLADIVRGGGTQTGTGTTTNPVGSVPTTGQQTPDQMQRRPGESLMDWYRRLQAAQQGRVAANAPAPDEVTQAGGPVDDGTLAQLYELLGGG